MHGVLRAEQLQPGAVHADAVEVNEVGVPALFAADRGEVDRAAGLVHRDEFGDQPRTRGDTVLEGAVAVVEVEVAETVPLGPPQELGSVAQYAPSGGEAGELIQFDVGRPGLFEEFGGGAGRGVHLEQRVALEVTAPMGVEDGPAVRGPLHIGVGGVATSEVAGLGVDVSAYTRSALDVEEPQFGRGDDRVTRQSVRPGVKNGPPVGGLEEMEALDLALVVAMGRDPARIRRPLKDR